MNADFDPMSRPELEAQITAMLLGELDPAEAAALRERLDRDPDLASWADCLARTLSLVRDAEARPQPVSSAESAPGSSPVAWPRMSDPRREALLRRLRGESTGVSTGASTAGDLGPQTAAGASAPAGQASPAGPVVIPVAFGTQAEVGRGGFPWLAVAAVAVAVMGMMTVLVDVQGTRMARLVVTGSRIADESSSWQGAGRSLQGLRRSGAADHHWSLSVPAAPGSGAGAGPAAPAAPSAPSGGAVGLDVLAAAPARGRSEERAERGEVVREFGDIEAPADAVVVAANADSVSFSVPVEGALQFGVTAVAPSPTPAPAPVAPPVPAAPAAAAAATEAEFRMRPELMRRYGLVPTPGSSGPREADALGRVEREVVNGPVGNVLTPLSAATVAAGTALVPSASEKANATPATALPGVLTSTWADFDHDGSLDLSAPQPSGDGGATRLYRNSGNGTFTVQDGSRAVAFDGELRAKGVRARGAVAVPTLGDTPTLGLGFQKVPAADGNGRVGGPGGGGPSEVQARFQTGPAAGESTTYFYATQNDSAAPAALGGATAEAVGSSAGLMGGVGGGGFGGGGGGGGGVGGAPVALAKADRSSFARADALVPPGAVDKSGGRPANRALNERSLDFLAEVAAPASSATPGSPPPGTPANEPAREQVVERLGIVAAGAFEAKPAELGQVALSALDDTAKPSAIPAPVALSRTAGAGRDAVVPGDAAKKDAEAKQREVESFELQPGEAGAKPGAAGQDVMLGKRLAAREDVSARGTDQKAAKAKAAEPEAARKLVRLAELAPAEPPTQPVAAGLAPVRGLGAQAGKEEAEVRQRVEDRPAKPAPAPSVPVPVPQPEQVTAENAFSTFSLNVADVSFKLAGASLENGALPAPGSIRSEEFLNAFQYRDPDPAPGAPLAFAWERARYPFAHNRDLLRLAVRTASTGREAGRPMNLVLVLDNSGSMERADRVRILREALGVLAGKLQPNDRISVVAFARTARLWVDALPGARAGELVGLVGNLVPEGGTNLEDALRVAYETALKHFLAEGANRVVLLTDGAANLGDVDPDSLKKLVESYRRRGVALDGFGIGWEGYNDDLLEVLTRNGDGRYGFVNTPEEAATGFAGQLAGALQVAAADVKVQVEFNPRRVSAWRQIGYARHQLTQQQFRDNTVDAAEIGAAESGNALYVIETDPRGEGPVATVRVRFRVPSSGLYEEHAWTVPFQGAAPALDQAPPSLRLAASAASFAEWLAGSPFAADVNPDRLLSLMSGVKEAFEPDPRPGRLEWMIRQARSVGGR